ncbi:MAG: hypothetical protein KF757_03920 [Phycisphaeraceae bacterium]|nr:hypothetical protein [Phycisphaeraceae bacterium]MCW5763148.1 hypothetical protein [Phycisphaeraceae bacterium]
MSSKKSLHTVALPSTDFIVPAYWDEKGPSPAIRFSYDKDGVEYRSGIEFRRVLAMRWRAERCCTAWHIEGAYDTLVEVENSLWVQELRADTYAQWRDKWETHHYMIYLDGVSFEVVAESWAALPDEPAAQ